MKRLFIIANRLPVKASETEDGFSFTRSEGGLATGLNDLQLNYEKHWVGWPGVSFEKQEDVRKADEILEKDNIHAVHLSEQEVELYYESYSNKTLWPLFHYFNELLQFDERAYDVYKKVNERFADRVASLAKPGDIIWIHDYHLMLLPGKLRNRLPDQEIGFFLHTPFPSSELFRILPERKEILKGILGADLIGFHTYDYMRHFLSACYRLLGYEATLGGIFFDNRTVQIESFPMGIDYERYNSAINDKGVKKELQTFRETFGQTKTILSVDRLDYSKGLLKRLEAFDCFLTSNPEFKGKVALLLLIVPSRDTVESYRQLKKRIDTAVGEINGRHGTFEWTPINYMYRSLEWEQLAAFYSFADIALVTPLRDGMNLVAKEYIASRRNGDGVLILSEMAGAAIELREAILVNPYDTEAMASAIGQALNMPASEEKERVEAMQMRLSRQTVTKWAADFILNLDRNYREHLRLEQKILNERVEEEICRSFASAKDKLLLLDYDGTLVPFVNDPQKAKPDDELIGLLKQLVSTGGTEVVIISGRDKNTLEGWFGSTGVKIVAEHGSYYKMDGKWEHVSHGPDIWKKFVLEIFNSFTEKTPGSFIEEKALSLVWHYRKADAWLAELRVSQLLHALIYPCSKLDLEILEGNKVVEVKMSGYDKGKAAQRWLNIKTWDFILAIGDDRTDEDLFKAIPPQGYSLKVGNKPTNARFKVQDLWQVRAVLESLARSCGKS